MARRGLEHPRADRFVGCVVGQCLGSALALVVEDHSDGACAAFVVQWLQGGKVRDLGSARMPLGQYGHAAQFAREFLLSWVRQGGRFVPADVAAAIARMYAEDRVVGQAPAIEGAVRRLLEGEPWDAAAAQGAEALHGPAGRAGVVGLVEPEDRDRLLQAARDVSRITHRGTVHGAAAAAIARAVALAWNDPLDDPQVFLADVASVAGALDPIVGETVLGVEDWLERSPDEIQEAVEGADPGLPPLREGRRAPSAAVLASLAWSLYAHLRSPGDYWQTVCTAIAAGGDVATTAAMAGGLAGARCGLQALPSHLLARLEDQGTWQLPDLVELSLRAWSVVEGKKAAGDPDPTD